MCDFDEIFPEDDEATSAQGVDCAAETEGSNDVNGENERTSEKQEDTHGDDISEERRWRPPNSNIDFDGNNPHKYYCEKCGYTWWEKGWVTRCKNFYCTGRAIQID